MAKKDRKGGVTFSTKTLEKEVHCCSYSPSYLLIDDQYDVVLI